MQLQTLDLNPAFQPCDKGAVETNDSAHPQSNLVASTLL